jgi:hypothetical protein
MPVRFTPRYLARCSTWGSASTAFALIGCLAIACSGEEEGRPDKDLGDLVISPEEEIPAVDLDKASQSSEALLTALRLPHTWVAEKLGAHQVRGSSRLSVKEGDTPLEDLDDELALDFDAKGRFQATLDNSKNYGRHAIYDGKELYLRPRFGKYHTRAPQTETETGEIRNEIFAGATDYLDLFENQLEVSDQGAKTFEGRAVRQIALKLAPERKKLAPSGLTQKAWRNTIEVQAIEGLVSLDAESGVALKIEFAGKIAYERDKRRFTMELAATRVISDIGHKRTITAPDDALVLRIPARRRELDERESLLKGIAPPARKAPTPPASEASGSP